MKLICLDLEGVLVPEIWVAFAEASKIPELKKTTRDEPDYDKLMRWRLSVLKEHGLGLKEIQISARPRLCQKPAGSVRPLSRGPYQIFCSPGKNHARPGGFPNSRRQGHPGSRPSDALPYGKR